jgi:hypothetical protein
MDKSGRFPIRERNYTHENAQRQIAEIQRASPESIRACATEGPVFFSRARDLKSGACLDTLLTCQQNAVSVATHPHLASPSHAVLRQRANGAA